MTPVGWVLIILAILLALMCATVLAIVASKSVRAALLKAAAGVMLRERLANMPRRRNGARPVRVTRVPMRDGIALKTEIYLPSGEGPWPTILVRDPYGLMQYFICNILVRYGYACVHQDVRGRWGSGGEWRPFTNERNDGADTLDWILQQSWQNGRIAIIGESYLGITQWALADQLPPEVKTLLPGVSHGDIYEMAYRNGGFCEGVMGVWSYSLFQPPLKALAAAREWRRRVAGQFPALDVDPQGFGASWPAYREFLMHPERGDPFWQSPEYTALRDSYLGVRVPVFMVARSNDFFLAGMVRTFEALPTREQSVFILAPGDHGGVTGAAKVRQPYRRYFSDVLAWLDHHLGTAPPPAQLRPGYHLYVNGSDTWRHDETWPQTVAVETLHLADFTKAHACGGGSLERRAPEQTQSVSFDYDPRDPTPTRGGSFILSPAVSAPAVQDQGRDICARADVLSFASAPLTEDHLLAGSIQIRLLVSSSAPDTAFTVKLSEHFADGTAFNIRDDISTLRLRNNAIRYLAYAPGEQVEVEFNLDPIVWRLRAGSKLRLDVSSSNFPAFNAHPNSDALWSSVAQPAIAHQTLFSGSLTLPIAASPDSKKSRKRIA